VPKSLLAAKVSEYELAIIRILYITDDADKKIEVISVADRKEVYR
jgi:hypothetical protein